MLSSFGQKISATWTHLSNRIAAESAAVKLWSIRLLLIALALGQFIDVLTTNRALAAGGKEANPVMHLVMMLSGGQWWLWKAFIAVFLICLAITIRPPSWRRVGLAGVVAILQALVIINNLLRS